jgi:AraC-like DNA-binding protein
MEFSDYDLFVCTGGAAEFTFGGHSRLLEEGCALLVPKQTRVSAELHGNHRFEALAQHFELRIFADEDFFELLEYDPLVRFDRWEWVRELVLRLGQEPIDAGARHSRHALFRMILVEYLEQACRGLKNGDHPASHLVLEVLADIEREFTSDVSLAELLDRGPYTIDYVSRLFKRMMGRPPRKYLVYRRLQHSKDLLARGASVKEAAYGSGFRDEHYFSRTFKKYEGTAPSEYAGAQNRISSGTAASASIR